MRSVLTFSVVIISAVLFSSCVTGKFSLDHISGPLPGKIPLEETPGSEEYPEADRILLYENQEDDIDYVPAVGMETYRTVHRAWKILKNPDTFNDIYRSYSSDAEIISFAARTIRPDGTAIQLNERDVVITHKQKVSDD